MTFFAGFEERQIEVERGSIRLRIGGSGPALLLLHGNPQTHAMWHAVAPDLAKRYRVICPDLPGYGFSFKPEITSDHTPSSKRAMAKDLVQMLDVLGVENFDLVGHDRGARVAQRLALDHAERVKRLAVLDIIPTIEHFERADAEFAMGYYHWFWFAQPHPLPENVINAAPSAWFRSHTSREPKDVDRFFNSEALADYLAAVKNPAMISGMCEDYRAAWTIDRVHDRESREAGHRIQCPLLVLWGEKGKIGKWYDPLAIWSDYADRQPSGAAIASGHYLAEEAPEQVLSNLLPFLDSSL